MNGSENEWAELGQLCDALVDRRLGREEKARLSQILLESKDARRFYVRAVGLSASLHEYASEILSGEVTPEVALRIGKFHEWQVGRWMRICMGAAASLVLGGAALIFLSPDKELGTVGRISGTRACRWEGPGVQTGEWVESGRVLKLEDGSCELTLDSGARVVLEGPGQMQVVSAWKVNLERGILNAVVPHEAQGFRVEQAKIAAVVGGGAEFSVVAEEDPEVFVHQGSVAAGHEGAEGGLVVLGGREARRFGRGGNGEVRDREFKLSRLRKRGQLLRTLRPVTGQHWGFDQESEGAGDGVRGGGRLELGQAISFSDGVSGWAVRNPRGQSITLEVPWVRNLEEWSCAFWMRNTGESAVLCGESLLRIGGWIELCGNSRRGQGPLGALTGVSENGRKRWMTGEKSVLDGRWHHIVLEFSVRSSKSGRIQIKQYVDGRLEGGAVVRAAGNWRSGEKSWGRIEFSGVGIELDELCVADRVLTPAEILHVQAAHELPPPDFMVGL
jgi:ferric-dicitrate binding protein FerR (iron transport regulator)